jgi:hypothetical protein
MSNDHILNRGKTAKEALLRDNIGTPPFVSIEQFINPNNKKTAGSSLQPTRLSLRDP